VNRSRVSKKIMKVLRYICDIVRKRGNLCVRKFSAFICSSSWKRYKKVKTLECLQVNGLRKGQWNLLTKIADGKVGDHGSVRSVSSRNFHRNIRYDG
jgi:hypothetical protein